ncbi:uncharacterized protein LOC114326879 [Diabrotica virgifera virgifera]|uniref:Pacifastin domain-containing protein n=1 Tax=Diabrotica virgifera virgifera TaxID=50390 RepID=A0ABM5IEL2_DIAVI|nr:uncharacterized protein LOC114326879 [Diabrotica virgifera virgifera]
MDWRVIALCCIVCVNFSGATMCSPNSKFKMDCNFCICSSNGKEYTCTNDRCPQGNNNDQFYRTQTKDGHVLLVPKDKDQFKADDDAFVLTRNSRKPRVSEGYPYINDMMNKPMNDEDTSEDVEMIKPKRNSENLETSEFEPEVPVDVPVDDNADSNEIDNARWAPSQPRKVPDFPE